LAISKDCCFCCSGPSVATTSCLRPFGMPAAARRGAPKWALPAEGGLDRGRHKSAARFGASCAHVLTSSSDFALACSHSNWRKCWRSARESVTPGLEGRGTPHEANSYHV
jgi:hypothetical protein